MTPAKPPPSEERDAFRALLQAGLELGIAEAVRRMAALAPAGTDRLRRLELGGVLGAAVLAEFVQAARDDPSSVFQLVKEVWSRGGTKDRKTAARAVGQGLGKVAPHLALGLSRDLASMSRNAREADTVGTEAIGPILDVAPPLVERVKQFLQDNERWIRRAAIAGLVTYVTRRKKMAGLTLEIVLLVAEHKEKEIKSAVRWAVREASRVDWKGTAQALTAWAGSDATGGRVRAARQYVGATADSARRNVERYLVTHLARFANGTPKTRRR